MGIGDEIMASGEAERVYRNDPLKKKVIICDKQGRARMHEVWKGSPIIEEPNNISPEKEYTKITNGIGARPYAKAPFRNDEGWRWTDWCAEDNRGRIYLSESEKQFGLDLKAAVGNYIVIEPNVKVRSTRNKVYPFDKYAQVVSSIPRLFVQVGEKETRRLPGIVFKWTPLFRDACSILAQADLYVGSEGALHHAAAALNVPAVVFFGSAISTRNLGYHEHMNIVGPEDHAPCGSYEPCVKCQEFIDSYSEKDMIDTINYALLMFGK